MTPGSRATHTRHEVAGIWLFVLQTWYRTFPPWELRQKTVPTTSLMAINTTYNRSVCWLRPWQWRNTILNAQPIERVVRLGPSVYERGCRSQMSNWQWSSELTNKSLLTRWKDFNSAQLTPKQLPHIVATLNGQHMLKIRAHLVLLSPPFFHLLSVPEGNNETVTFNLNGVASQYVCDRRHSNVVYVKDKTACL